MTKRFRHKLRLFTLVAVLFSYSGGPFGMETMLPTSGPGMTLLLLVIIGPLVWGLPMILTVAELGAAVPIQGGSYRWARRALGDYWGFQCGWWQMLSSLLDQALYPVLIVTFLDELLHLGLSMYVVDLFGFSVPWLRWLLSIAVIASCALVNVRGVHWAGASAVGLNVLIVAPYLVFTALALLQVRHNPFTPLVPPGETVLGALGFGLLVAMWNYSGYEAPSSASEEIVTPERTVPKGLFIALPLEIVIYSVPVAAALMVRDDWMTWSEGSFVDIARTVGGIIPHGSWILASLITLATIAGCLSIFNVGLLLYPRLQFAMAEDRFLPRILARLHPRFETPWFAILLNSLFFGVLVMLPFEELLTVSIWVLIPSYLLIFISLWVLRFREPDLPRPVRLPGGWIGLALVTFPPGVLAYFALAESIREVIESASLHLIVFGLIGIVSGSVAYGIARAAIRRGD